MQEWIIEDCTTEERDIEMLIVRKKMTNEIVEYTASDKDALEIKKYNMHKDGTHKTNKFIDLNKTKLHDRYFANAGRLFEYLVLYKGYERR